MISKRIDFLIQVIIRSYLKILIQKKSIPFVGQAIIRCGLVPNRKDCIVLMVGEAVFLLFDKDKLERIVNNLLSNAFKFTPNNGVISFFLMFSSAGKNEFDVKMQVKDTGTGISEADQERLFERFLQVKEHRNVGNGTGIGLSLVKELVELFQGKIEVESKLNEGSCFTINLKLQKIADSELVDSSDNEQAIERLEKRGWRVFTKVHKGMEPPQHDKYLLWLNILKGNDPRYPKFITNGRNCKFTIIFKNYRMKTYTLRSAAKNQDTV